MNGARAAVLSLAWVLAAGCVVARPAGAAPGAGAAARAALEDSLQALHLGPDPAAAFAASEPHLAAARAAGDSAAVCRLLLLQGGGEAVCGRGVTAEPRLREALRLAQAARDTAATLQGLRLLSVAVQLQSRDEEARALYDRLRDLALAAQDSLHLAWSFVGHGYHAYLHGDPVVSARLYGWAAGIFARRGEARGEEWARNGRALALRRAGRLGEAAAEFRRTAAAAARSGNAMGEAMSWNFLGELELMQGDPAVAVACFETACRIHQAHDYRREAVAAARNLARGHELLARWDDALSSLRDAQAICRREGFGDLEGQLLVAEARVRRRQGRPREAAAVARQVLAMRDRLPPVTVVAGVLKLAEALADQDSVAAALALLADPAVAGGDHRDAVVALEAGLARGRLLLAAGRPREALGPLARAGAAAAAAGLSDVAADALAAEARAWHTLGVPDSALARLARGIAAWERQRGLPTDPQWRERRGAAGAELFTEAGALLAARGDVRAAFDLLQAYKARTLEERMRGVAAGPPERALGLRALQGEVLHAGEVYVDVYAGPRRGLVFAVTRDTCVLDQLPGEPAYAARLSILADVLRRPGSAAVAQRAEAAALAVGRELLPGAARLAAVAATVVWSPDGAWHALPVTLLTGALGDAQRVPSASILARLRRRPPPAPARAAVLTVSDPASPPGARAEVAWLARRFAGVEPAAGDLSGGTVVHVATHAVVDEQRPWNSAILRADDRVLRAGEVAELALPAHLCVLSCCEGARGQAVGGEGVLGLASGFLSAGATAVAGSLWPVDDAATARLTARFYEELAAGAPAARALAAAREALRAEPATAHPFYWAGFVLIGDGAVRVPLRERRSAAWGWALAAIAAAAVATVTSRRRRRPAARD